MEKPKLIDIHTHVNFNAFKDDGDAVVKRTLDAGVWMVLVGSQIDTSCRAVEYAERYPEGVYAAVGLHPIHLFEDHFDVAEEEKKAGLPAEALAKMGVSGFTTRPEVFDRDAYLELAKSSKTVAIGECGLDYYRGRDNEDVKRVQKETFRKQVHLAREVKKPLMIHCRDAYEDLLGILREERAEDIGGDIHFFAGSWEIAKQFLDLGFYLSFTGVITFARDYDEVLKNVPLDRIMVETDAPYVTPVPHRGKRNEPLYVEFVAKKIAELKGLDDKEVYTALVQNTCALFKIQLSVISSSSSVRLAY